MACLPTDCSSEQGQVQSTRRPAADGYLDAAPLAVTVSAGASGVRIARRRAADPRIVDVRVFRAPAGNPLARGSRGMHLVCSTLGPACVDATAPRGRTVRYVVVLRDRWGSSKP